MITRIILVLGFLVASLIACSMQEESPKSSENLPNLILEDFGYQLRSGYPCLPFGEKEVYGVEIRVKNTGSAEVGEFSITIGDKITYIYESLAPGQSQYMWFEGEYGFIAQVDPENQIEESNEADNELNTQDYNIPTPTAPVPCPRMT